MMRVSMAVAASTEGMPLARVPQTRSLSAVRAWIYTLAALVVLMVAVGGATRLTGSGLSITEWRPVTGAIPPLTQQAWLVWFWARGVIKGRLALTLLGIGALGGLQGAIGWIMVASGLEPGMTAVAPIKLTLHLITASAILASLIWVAVGLRPGRQAAGDRAGGAPVSAEG